MDVSVCIGTFGADRWPELARSRAIPSVPEGVPVIHKHGLTLAKARNAALAEVETEWVIHLDADDELGQGYVEAMARGTADLRAPVLQSVWFGKNKGPQFMPRVWGHDHECTVECLRYGNWLAIGTCARTELLREVGGWEEFGWSEDYALWARCWKAGGTAEPIYDAVYRAWRSARSRNRVANAEGLKWHREIEKAVWPEEPSVL